MTAVAIPATMSTRLRWASNTWDLLLAVTLRDLRVKYRGTIFSYLWWLARPLTLGTVLYFALNRVLDLRIENHGVFLLTGLFPWFWFAGTVNGSTGAFVGNAGLVKKVRFPRPVLPLSVVLGHTIEFVFTLPVLLLFVLLSGIRPEWTWIVGIPALIVLQMALLSGLSMIVSAINVFFRDLGPALDSVVLILFYVTPIIYPLDRVPEGVKPILLLNPLASLIEAWRELFLQGELPGLSVWPAVAITIAAVIGGYVVMRAVAKSLADAL
jgi:ABC-type polysaccharide/polyol phosphate export permease